MRGTPPLLSRRDWGADESLRFDSEGREIWPPESWPVQKLIVHHTAWDGDESAGAATVREIYRAHAVDRGWGDIGYGYLIDRDGVVYEGRNGGGTGAHVEGYNSGSIGIALLGTFVERGPSEPARRSLVLLLGTLCGRHSIDPLGLATYENPASGERSSFPNVAGHRDLAETECPGAVLRRQLPEIRREVADRVLSGPRGADPR